ncbi:hypothetical protein H8A99_05630 [Bradyrhizobium sp. Arg68]|uniref:hypothetical protein n=1 Tax=Bradyrhizobium ivorense TaxID=2511166 RepID=UPI001E4E541C|nr:hypothetical protein [Bradyrhizobium ivorense]MCC8935983.1 hypothetical protein [Bradyrhizobium ivorense]
MKRKEFVASATALRSFGANGKPEVFPRADARLINSLREIGRARPVLSASIVAKFGFNEIQKFSNYAHHCSISATFPRTAEGAAWRA